jgi:hypothetical protein
VARELIRPATPEEFAWLRQIEEAADEMFGDVGIGPFQVPEDEDHLAQAAAAALVPGAHPWALAV